MKTNDERFEKMKAAMAEDGAARRMMYGMMGMAIGELIADIPLDPKGEPNPRFVEGIAAEIDGVEIAIDVLMSENGASCGVTITPERARSLAAELLVLADSVESGPAETPSMNQCRCCPDCTSGSCNAGADDLPCRKRCTCNDEPAEDDGDEAQL